MIRAALAYLVFAIAGILLVTGLPFGGGPTPDLASESAPVEAAPAPAQDYAIFGGLSDWFAARQKAREVAVEAETLASTEPVQSSKAVDVELLVTRALAAGQSPEELDALINAAAERGSVQVPLSMITTEGRVDTDVLTASVMARGQIAPIEQGDTSSEDSFVTPQTAILDIQDMIYVVQAGDSLAGLALKFYGKADLAAPIFEANRDQLAAPDALIVGQTLTIPSRSKL